MVCMQQNCNTCLMHHERKREKSSTDKLLEDLLFYSDAYTTFGLLCAGRAGVPMEVMGLMLGEFVDDYTVTVKDVFAMPQSGTGVSVEAVDPVFQTDMYS